MIRFILAPLVVVGLASMITACPEGEPGDAGADVHSGVDIQGAETDSVDAATPTADVQVDADAEPSIDGGGGDLPTVDIVGPACDPPLALEGLPELLGTLAYISVVPTGGTGAYRFDFAANGSDGLINELTGAYVAGDIGESLDVIRVTDAGCHGEVTATIEVVSDPVVVPAPVTAPPGSCVQLVASLGSGQFAYEDLSQTPVGTIDDTGLYQAGDVEGQDTIRVTDVITSRTVDVSVTVAEGSRLDTTTDLLVLPLGARHELPAHLGSGSYDVSVSGDAVIWDADAIVATAPGDAELTITDSYMGCDGGTAGPMTVTLPVRVVSAHRTVTHAFADGHASSLLAAGDLDGDGGHEAVLGLTDHHARGFWTGAAVVLSAKAGEVTVSQIIGGPTRQSEFGRSMALGDLDGDGRPELAVGAHNDATGGGGRGAVYVYRGLQDGTFDEEPAWAFHGPKNNDNLGMGVAICDFDGDGAADLAIGSERAEDESLEEVPNDGGSVQVHRGGPDGPAEVPSVIRFGAIPADDGTWQPAGAMRMGGWLSAGDMDGDGRCELAATARLWKQEGSSDDGAVFVYRGDPDTVLSQWPTLAWASSDPDDQKSMFGRHTLITDLNGDGFGDLIAAQRRHREPGGSNNVGAVRVFSGGPQDLAAPAAFSAPEDADWTIRGDQGSDELGVQFSVADVNGDGLADLLVGSVADEAFGEPSNTGSLRVYPGVSDAWPRAAPTRTVGGVASGDRFGWSVATIGDMNADGAAEIVSWAPTVDELGPDLGRAYVTWGAPDPAIPWGSEWAYDASGIDLGDAWTALDFDDSAWLTGFAELGFGDGDEETVIEVSDPPPPSIYFRKVITLDTAMAWGRLRTRHNNGIVVWVNGQQIFGHNLKDDISFEALSSTGSGNDSLQTVTLVPEDDLQWPFEVGQNVVAVMIKQGKVDDPDMSFDLDLELHPTEAALEGYTAPVEIPGPIGAAHVGTGLTAGVDMTGDGLPDLLVGAREESPEGIGKRAGSVFVYPGLTGGGYSVESSQTLGGFPLHTSNARLGHRIASGGDFDGDGGPDVLMMARDINRLGTFPDGTIVSGSCPADNGNTSGAVAVWPVGGDAPSHLFYGPQAGQRVRELAGDLDYNGDGLSDLLAAAYTWDIPGANDVGGVSYVAGRPSGAGPMVECAADAQWYGLAAGDYLGRSVAALGDLNGDDCDETAIGASREDLGNSNQGTVRVVFGWGNKCSPKNPRVLLFGPKANNSWFGRALAGGHDVDGDGVPDLVVGGADYRVGSLRAGAVWLLSGAYLLSLMGDAVDGSTDTLPGATSDDLLPLVPDGVDESAYQLIGTYHQGRFGASVTLAPGLGPGGTAAIVVGEEQGARSGVAGSGGLLMYVFEDGALQTRPLLIFGGETHRPEVGAGYTGGQRGWLGAKHAFTTVDGVKTLSVSGLYLSPIDAPGYADNGAVYTVTLPQWLGAGGP